MYVRIKKSGKHEYLQIVTSFRYYGGTKQKVIASLGRLDQYLKDGTLYDLGHSFIGLHEKLKPKPPVRRRKKKRRLGPLDIK
jgi:hypothetical protein